MHLEVTTDVNVNSVLLVLRRFFARKYIPNVKISDNFKAFKAQGVKIFCKVNSIKWTFILERFPKKILGRARLTYDKIHTLICKYCEYKTPNVFE